MKKVFSNYKCYKSDVIQEVIEYLESIMQDKYVNNPFTIIIEVIDENQEDE